MPLSLIPFILFLFFGAFICAPQNLRNKNAARLKMHKAINEKGDPSWEEYKLTYGKIYANVEDEQLHRDAFESNKAKIQEHNAAFARGDSNFTLGFSHLTDWTAEERKRLGGYRPKNVALFFAKEEQNDNSQIVEFTADGIDMDSLNETVDWRNENLVTPVKDQGDCGDCWAFATVGAFEAAHAKATGNLVSLSEQSLLDCDKLDGGNCSAGAFLEPPFEFVLNRGYLSSESAYPYEAKPQQCKSAKISRRDRVSMSKLQKIYQIKDGDEQALKAAVALHGPVATGFASNGYEFQHLGSETMDVCSNSELNHAILIIGYGTDENGVDYWLIKNSWAETWGNEGYGKIARNRGNFCGIGTGATFVA